MRFPNLLKASLNILSGTAAGWQTMNNFSATGVDSGIVGSGSGRGMLQ